MLLVALQIIGRPKFEVLAVETNLSRDRRAHRNKQIIIFFPKFKFRSEICIVLGNMYRYAQHLRRGSLRALYGAL